MYSLRKKPWPQPAIFVVVSGCRRRMPFTRMRKCVVTHANSGIWKMTHDQIKRCIDLGAWMEYSYITNLWGPGTGLPDFERMSDKEFADFARIAPQRSIITTDLGQVGMPHPVDGMRRCILALLENGLAQK